MDRTWHVLEAVREIAERRGVGMAQVALNWLREREGVSSVLLGARTVRQLSDNLAALDWDLAPDEMACLDAVSAPGIPDYVQGFLQANAGVDVWRRLRTGREA